MHHRLSFVPSAVAALFSVSIAFNAHAAPPSPEQCIDQFESVLPLRKGGKLLEARARLAACAVPACPAEVRDECTRQLASLAVTLPSIVFEVKAPSGAPQAAVSLSVDGNAPAQLADGAALELDPGPHQFSFTVAGEAPVTRTLTLAVGEKGRRETVVLPSAAAAKETVAERSSLHADSDGGSSRPLSSLRIAGIASTAAGVLAIGFGSAFGVMAISKSHAQKTECPDPVSCTAAGYTQALNDHSSGLGLATASTVTFSLGAALVVAGAALWLLAPNPADRDSSHLSVRVSPTVSPSAFGMNVSGAF